MGRAASCITAALGTALLAGCAAPAAQPDAFEQTGELIALSGGAAGARAACVTCHGLGGQGDGNRAPRLAGLDRGYLARALIDYETGRRRHPQMQWIAGQLSGEARQRVAAYYADLPATAAAPPISAQADCRGAVLYHLGDEALGVASCASCHGADGSGNAGNPPLAGQPAPYLAAQLDAWASGARYGDASGIMRDISRRLSAWDRRAAADYAATLQGGSARPTVPAACLRTRRPDRPGGA